MTENNWPPHDRAKMTDEQKRQRDNDSYPHGGAGGKDSCLIALIGMTLAGVLIGRVIPRRLRRTSALRSS